MQCCWSELKRAHNNFHFIENEQVHLVFYVPFHTLFIQHKKYIRQMLQSLNAYEIIYVDPSQIGYSDIFIERKRNNEPNTQYTLKLNGEKWDIVANTWNAKNLKGNH